MFVSVGDGRRSRVEHGGVNPLTSFESLTNSITHALHQQAKMGAEQSSQSSRPSTKGAAFGEIDPDDHYAGQ